MTTNRPPVVFNPSSSGIQSLSQPQSLLHRLNISNPNSRPMAKGRGQPTKFTQLPSVNPAQTPPTFASFKFNTIGRQPDLLQRLSGQIANPFLHGQFDDDTQEKDTGISDLGPSNASSLLERLGLSRDREDNADDMDISMDGSPVERIDVNKSISEVSATPISATPVPSSADFIPFPPWETEPSSSPSPITSITLSRHQLDSHSASPLRLESCTPGPFDGLMYPHMPSPEPSGSVPPPDRVPQVNPPEVDRAPVMDINPPMSSVPKSENFANVKMDVDKMIEHAIIQSTAAAVVGCSTHFPSNTMYEAIIPVTLPNGSQITPHEKQSKSEEALSSIGADLQGIPVPFVASPPIVTLSLPVSQSSMAFPVFITPLPSTTTSPTSTQPNPATAFPKLMDTKVTTKTSLLNTPSLDNWSRISSISYPLAALFEEGAMVQAAWEEVRVVNAALKQQELNENANVRDTENGVNSPNSTSRSEMSPSSPHFNEGSVLVQDKQDIVTDDANPTTTMLRRSSAIQTEDVIPHSQPTSNRSNPHPLSSLAEALPASHGGLGTSTPSSDIQPPMSQYRDTSQVLPESRLIDNSAIQGQRTLPHNTEVSKVTTSTSENVTTSLPASVGIPVTLSEAQMNSKPGNNVAVLLVHSQETMVADRNSSASPQSMTRPVIVSSPMAHGTDSIKNEENANVLSPRPVTPLTSVGQALGSVTISGKRKRSDTQTVTVKVETTRPTLTPLDIRGATSGPPISKKRKANGSLQSAVKEERDLPEHSWVPHLLKEPSASQSESQVSTPATAQPMGITASPSIVQIAPAVTPATSHVAHPAVSPVLTNQPKKSPGSAVPPKPRNETVSQAATAIAPHPPQSNLTRPAPVRDRSTFKISESNRALHDTVESSSIQATISRRKSLNDSGYVSDNRSMASGGSRGSQNVSRTNSPLYGIGPSWLPHQDAYRGRTPPREVSRRPASPSPDREPAASPARKRGQPYRPRRGGVQLQFNQRRRSMSPGRHYSPPPPARSRSPYRTVSSEFKGRSPSPISRPVLLSRMGGGRDRRGGYRDDFSDDEDRLPQVDLRNRRPDDNLIGRARGRRPVSPAALSQRGAPVPAQNNRWQDLEDVPQRGYGGLESRIRESPNAESGVVPNRGAARRGRGQNNRRNGSTHGSIDLSGRISSGSQRWPLENRIS